MKLTEHIGLNTCLGRICHGNVVVLIKNDLRFIHILQILIHICVKSYKIPSGLRKHVQISSFGVLTGAKDAEKYFTDEFIEENK